MAKISKPVKVSHSLADGTPCDKEQLKKIFPQELKVEFSTLFAEFYLANKEEERLAILKGQVAS